VKFENMDLRDWFAGQAISGILASTESCLGTLTRDRDQEKAAKLAYKIADKLLTAREGLSEK
jgi:hypothetical protein